MESGAKRWRECNRRRGMQRKIGSGDQGRYAKGNGFPRMRSRAKHRRKDITAARGSRRGDGEQDRCTRGITFSGWSRAKRWRKYNRRRGIQKKRGAAGRAAMQRGMVFPGWRAEQNTGGNVTAAGEYRGREAQRAGPLCKRKWFSSDGGEEQNAGEKI